MAVTDQDPTIRIDDVHDSYELYPLPPDESESARVWAGNMAEAYDVLAQGGWGHKARVEMSEGEVRDAFFPDPEKIRGADMGRLISALADVRPSAYDFFAAQGPYRASDPYVGLWHPAYRNPSLVGSASQAGIRPEEYLVETSNGSTAGHVEAALSLAGLAGANRIRRLRNR